MPNTSDLAVVVLDGPVELPRYASGAPLLLEGTDTVVALNSFGRNSTCKGSDYSYRVDTAYAQDWLAGFRTK